MKRQIIVGIIALLGLISFFPANAQMPVGLHVSGVTLQDAAGNRFVISGINLETWRDKGCSWVTEGEYPARAIIANKLQSIGVNAVRMNYSYAWLNETGNLDKFMDIAQELVNRGMYVMPSDHTYTGKSLVNSAAVYPMFQKIIEAARARGIEQWVIMNPFNEPGGDPPIAWSAWLAAQKNALTFLRSTVGFQGVVILDTRTWALDYDAASFDTVLAWDAGLRGGVANVVFSQHYYPTNGMSPVDNAFANSGKYPFISGEVGQYNASPIDPQYVRDVIAKWFNVAKDKGHNGLFAWIGMWCDDGKMFDDWTNPSVAYSDPLVLTSYGQIWATNYFSKFAQVPPPQPTIIVQQPTATPTRTAPLPTNTPRQRTPTRTATDVPVVIITNTPVPTGVVGCVAVIEQTVTFNGRAAKSTTCITYQ